jgi:crotonobetainyl-CoA:carnitine CoA-transferase CaiB-like acyl-CoA transferase
VAEALADDQAAARDLIDAAEHPVLGTVRQVRTPLRFSTHTPKLARGPFLGEHSAELLHDDPHTITHDD